jgi:apolipoprotein N-acyltransferase
VKSRVLWPARHEAVAALASAVLFALAFPPVPLLIPVFVCLVPMAIGIARQADGDGTVRGAVRIGFWFAIVGYGSALYWIAGALSLFTKLAILGFVGAIVWLGIMVAIVAMALYAMRRVTKLPLAILLPVVWTAGELVLAHFPDLSFPWLPLGLATVQAPVLAQLAEVSGVRGVSFWVAAVNGLVADLWMLHRAHSATGRDEGFWRRPAAMGRVGGIAAIFALVTAYGIWRTRTIELRTFAPIAVVQPNIPQDEKWQAEQRDRIVGIIAGITRDVLPKSDAELVVWPEVALPGYLLDHPEWRDTLHALATIDSTPILFGVLDVDFRTREDYDYYNAAMLTDRLGIVGAQPAYRKGHLVPIVERVPFVNPRWFSGMKYFGAFGIGTETDPFELASGRAGVLICYESIYPQRSRGFRRNGADILINITNDAWFGRSLAPWQHHAHLILRAIETRVGIVRSANTGISGYIDPLGIDRGRTALFVAAAPTYVAQTTDITTPYVLFGDWLGVLSLIATAAGTAAYAVQHRRRARGIAQETASKSVIVKS